MELSFIPPPEIGSRASSTERRRWLVFSSCVGDVVRPPAGDDPSDVALLDFVFELGEIAARGSDIRPRLFGTA